MFFLHKIKELKGYRFFHDYKWDESCCSLFAQNNLIYGWNGSGKTTLCDFFKELEDGTITTDGASFSLLFQDANSKEMKQITQNSFKSIPYVFKVFHQNYIQENIHKDNVKHIFTVGKEQTDKLTEIKRLRNLAEQQAATVKRVSDEHSALVHELDSLKTANAKNIKSAANYTNAYNKNRYYNAHQALSSKKILSETEYQKALTAIRTEPRPIVPIIKVSFIQQTVREYISNILTQTPVNTTIDALKQDAAISSWVEQGLSLHEEKRNTSCLFCGNEISDTRFEALRNHFNKSYKELSDKIDNAITLLLEKHKQFEDVSVILPNAGLLYPEYQEQYRLLVGDVNNLCNHYKATILKIIDILNRKKSNMINDTLLTEFSTLIYELSFDYSVFENINALLDKHNQKTENFQKSIVSAQKAVELHLISSYADNLIAFEKRVKKKDEEAKQEGAVLGQQIERISKLEREVKNSQIPADEINRDIAFITGRAELIFENTECGYRITRKGKQAKRLSKGEENTIALIYFFNALKDIGVDAANTIVILDDPISSFDSNFYYNVISYIREKTLNVGQTFIFTHKFALLKDFSMMFKENTNKYLLQRSQNAPQLINMDHMLEAYHDEYAYLFKKVYTFVKSPPNDTSEYLQYPNIARRVLEGFLTFKLPSTDTLMNKVLKLEQGRNTAAGRGIMRLLNNHSHLRIIPDGDLADDIDSITVLPDILNHLMEFIKYHDKRHYDTLAALCDPEYNAAGNAVEIVRFPIRKVNLYTMTASAGPGDFLDNDPPSQTFDTNNQECTYAVKISGNSMEPEVHDGDIVLVKQCDDVPNARIGIVWYKGVCYCKKLVKKGNELLLVSSNKDYRPIPVDSFDEYHLFGEVVDIVAAKRN